MSLKRSLNLVKRLLGKPKVKNSLIVLILLLTIAAFVHFFAQHPDYIRQLGRTNPWWIVAVVALNIPMIILLVFIYDACLGLCGKRLDWRENFLLTSYSSIVNFFGPLQSGPGVRAAYLKTRHQVRLRDYTLATLIYYGLFAFFSALFLLVGTRPWWQTTVALLAVAGVSYFFIKAFIQRDKKPADSQFHLHGDILARLVLLTFLQVLLTAITYFVELKAVNPHIGWSQAVSYSGAANFALFVSLTPDAIGFREAFLLFSQHLHHVSTANILSANIIDRGSYVIFLVLLFLVVLGTHAQDRLRLRSLNRHA
ncbi:MAG TPA: lysylphosphatidylglycerol synthase transmembrane domain-containing protein [Candidatus Saccharimonadales bacterium]|nr:lysylphosphatidylglycerol synthase transmembrane domain-containing protein [Candidatus Saccharimonadales bacterium]